jgi:5-methylcytosine-specific restriction endonuclease McrA
VSLVEWDRPHFKGNEPSRHDRKVKRKADAEANWRTVCKQVDTRDHYRCRCCGAQGNPDGIDPLDKLHRHHLTFRSKGGQDVASNLCLLCPRCHDAVHVKRTLRIEATSAHGADGGLDFWRTDDRGEWLVKHETACGVADRD